MKNLTHSRLEPEIRPARSIKGWKILLALALVAALAVLLASAWAPSAQADAGGLKGHTFDVTFTKWITNFPNMAGVVGGDVGPGAFKGEILNIGTVGTITSIEALYHVNGSRHSFTAHVFVTQDDAAGRASITGRVTDGWLVGSPVLGEYKVLDPCPIPTPGNAYTFCFQGTLGVHRGPAD